MRIFITGGCGFIGTHLKKSLLEMGHEITIFDNFSNSSREKKKKKQKKMRIIEGDIRNYDDISKSIEGNELVIHLAAKISVTESIINPEETFDVNVKGSENVLRACKEHGVERIIGMSSAAIYGENKTPERKMRESDTSNPLSPYGESKVLMENTFKKISENSKIQSVIVRLFNVYGKGQSDEYAGVISKFSDCIKNNTSLTVFGDGNQTRDFVAIEDFVEFIKKLVNKKFDKKFNIFNIGSGESLKIIDLAKLIIEIAGSKNQICFDKKREGEITHSVANMEKTQKELKYKPDTSLKKGLERFLDY